MTTTPCVEAVLTVLTLQVQPGQARNIAACPTEQPSSCSNRSRGWFQIDDIAQAHQCYDVEDKAEKPLTLRRIGAQLLRSE